MNEDIPAVVDRATAERLLSIQSQILAQLKTLTAEEYLERGKTVVVQQAMLIHSVDELNQTMRQTSDRYELTIQRMNAAFMSLIKVPVACILIASTSWAYMYAKVISENTWLLMMAIAAFPWLGDSISAVAKMFGLGRSEQK